MKPYSYRRSTTSCRLRAALNFKELPYETVPVDLIAGAQCSPKSTALNHGCGVPVLMLEDGTVLTQSLAILDYLQVVATPRLLPEGPVQRARVMACAHGVSLDIHPVNNFRVTQHLRNTHGVTPGETKVWMQHWMTDGFTALEAMVSQNTSFAFGETPDLADLCIVAQIYNAHRLDLDMKPYPHLSWIEAACLTDPAINAARPENQSDAPHSTKAPA
ncbi:maleylacetoacetate isomerase [Tateyamaria pelophila]|uniref:maleylacetoacetate isomerase n=1 Tax=Tateyamaria pelophila TaxID=328415 RepID=UPI001CBF457B|nr:maleylacetoacetate isomerase [Tateyamaria pelophila]